MSEPADHLTSQIVAALGDANTERAGRVVRSMGAERAGALLAEAGARAARDGGSDSGAAPAETLARHFFDLVWEQAGPTHARWITGQPQPPIDWSQYPGEPLLLDRPSGKRLGCLGFFAVAEHLFAALVAFSLWFGAGMSHLGDCGCSASTTSSEWNYRPIAWWSWLPFLALIVACLVAAARSRPKWRWAWWLAALLAPWAWLVLVNLAFRTTLG